MLCQWHTIMCKPVCKEKGAGGEWGQGAMTCANLLDAGGATHGNKLIPC